MTTIRRSSSGSVPEVPVPSEVPVLTGPLPVLVPLVPVPESEVPTEVFGTEAEVRDVLPESEDSTEVPEVLHVPSEPESTEVPEPEQVSEVPLLSNPVRFPVPERKGRNERK